MIRVQLSDKVNAICKANYHGWEKKVNWCHRCPIRNECGAGCQYSWEGLNEYTEKLNAAAEKVVL